MTKTWVCADPHFGHEGMVRFTRDDSSKLRPFDTVQEMDEALVNNWNSVVSDADRVYLLGDVVINRRALSTLYRLKGRKVLVKGNHDIFRIEDYLPHFDDIRAYVVQKFQDKRIIMSHVPIHPDSLWTDIGINIHGHLHARKLDDPRYICVSMEHINYTPVEVQELLKEHLARPTKNSRD